MGRALTGDERRPEGFDIRPVPADDEAELRCFHEVLESAFADTPDFQPTHTPPGARLSCGCPH